MTDQDQAKAPGWYVEPGTGQTRWWDGAQWGAYQTQPVAPQVSSAVPVVVVNASAAPRNGLAVAALVLGICGFILTAIPLFIGLFLGGIPDILAIIFGIMGIVRARKLGGVGKAPAIIGLIFGSLGFLAIFIGGGTIW